jgi:hypothetical protein
MWFNDSFFAIWLNIDKVIHAITKKSLQGYNKFITLPYICLL